ncbi:hypothetical protein KEM55_006144, partial [Ascosphaera atra]
LILKHNAHKDTINIKESKNGLDFFFAARNEAERLVDFLASVAPVTVKKSQQLVSMDVHTSVKSYKISFSVEIIPICKDDLVVLPMKLARQLGNIHPLTLCYRVGTSVSLIDTNTLQTADIPANIYWRQPFQNLADVSELVEFIVMDIEPIGTAVGSFYLAEATVSPANAFGDDDQIFYVKTHLGGILHAGDTVLGYHLTRSNYNDPNFEALENSNLGSTIPDVVLVKKSYPRKRKNKNRNWKLKRMAREAEEDEQQASNRRADRTNAARVEDDFEMFLRDVEEDEELRSTLALYKANNANKPKADKMEVEGEGDAMEQDEEGDDDEEDGVPKINMDELLDDFEEMGIRD